MKRYANGDNKSANDKRFEGVTAIGLRNKKEETKDKNYYVIFKPKDELLLANLL